MIVRMLWIAAKNSAWTASKPLAGPSQFTTNPNVTGTVPSLLLTIICPAKLLALSVEPGSAENSPPFA